MDNVNPFWQELVYFLLLSGAGFMSLKVSRPRRRPPPANVDLFFTAVSASTVSSMSTVDMEVFSSLQLVFMTFMMFLGGEVFTSMIGLLLVKSKMKRRIPNVFTAGADSDRVAAGDGVEIGKVCVHPNLWEKNPRDDGDSLKLKSVALLSTVVSVYLLAATLSGSIAIFVYLSSIPSARRILRRKGLNLQVFAVFTAVSTFTNCGYVPTNENMAVFKKNSGLLLILIPQILMGNTMYPICLRASIWVAGKFTRSKKKEYRYMAENGGKLGYDHLLAGRRCVYLGMSGLGFIALQLAVFCAMEWKSAAVGGGGLNGYQKLVASLFQVVNSRHTGELVFDLSAISSAVLVLFVFMMYLPPYTSYAPISEGDTTKIRDDDCDNNDNNNDHDVDDICKVRRENKKMKLLQGGFWENMFFSQLTYLTIFVILICITERHSIKTDPLNFNVLNVVVEVISAYGNVGFSVGYSCARQITPDGRCKDASYGFAGRWSNEGKFVLIIVMFFGRLKKYTRRGGRAWALQ
ncbi:sodium transporter HKT1 isoform X2 [Andrographis paniculata]|uniref:sodium transporter HKT1 isoform X2 n=1 Tax=Andrographis paniculata TaxID=175694 RepID=UPI0021E8616C|nr:sodium transporter HKT1 isoform X2 [Andrographis paniculata]